MIYVTTYGDIYVLNIGFVYVCSVWAPTRKSDKLRLGRQYCLLSRTSSDRTWCGPNRFAVCFEFCVSGCVGCRNGDSSSQNTSTCTFLWLLANELVPIYDVSTYERRTLSWKRTLTWLRILS